MCPNMWTFMENRWSQLNASQFVLKQEGKRLGRRSSATLSWIQLIEWPNISLVLEWGNFYLISTDLGFWFPTWFYAASIFSSSFFRFFEVFQEVLHKNSFVEVRSIDENIGMSRHESAIINENVCDITSAMLVSIQSSSTRYILFN